MIIVKRVLGEMFVDLCVTTKDNNTKSICSVLLNTGHASSKISSTVYKQLLDPNILPLFEIMSLLHDILERDLIEPI